MHFKGIVSSLLLALSVAGTAHANNDGQQTNGQHVDAVMAIKVAGEARSLWHAHVATVGDYAVAVASDNLDLAKAIQPIALSVSPNMTRWLGEWYGDKSEALGQFEMLFTDHIQTLAGIIDAAKQQDQEKVAMLKTKLVEGGEKLSEVIESLNPQAYPRPVVLALLAIHEELSVAAGSALIAKDWQQGYALHVSAFEQSRQVADALSKGIFMKNGKGSSDGSADASAAAAQGITSGALPSAFGHASWAIPVAAAVFAAVSAVFM